MPSLEQSDQGLGVWVDTRQRKSFFFLLLHLRGHIWIAWGRSLEAERKEQRDGADADVRRGEARARQGQENSLTDKSRAGSRDFAFARLPRNAPARYNRA